MWWFVDRAADGEARFIAKVRVNHGGGNVFVSQKLLHGANIVAAFEQVGGEALRRGAAAGRENFQNA